MIVRSYLDKLGFSIMPSLPSKLDEEKGKIDIVHVMSFALIKISFSIFFVSGTIYHVLRRCAWRSALLQK